MFRWFFTGGSSWSDRDRRRRWDEKADMRARQRARRQRRESGRGKRKDLGFGLYWE